MQSEFVVVFSNFPVWDKMTFLGRLNLTTRFDEIKLLEVIKLMLLTSVAGQVVVLSVSNLRVC